MLWNLGFGIRKIEPISKKKKVVVVNKEGVSLVVFDVKGVTIQSMGQGRSL